MLDKMAGLLGGAFPGEYHLKDEYGRKLAVDGSVAVTSQDVALQMKLLSMPQPVVQHILFSSSSAVQRRAPREEHSSSASASVACLPFEMNVGLQMEPKQVLLEASQQRMACCALAAAH